MAFLYVALLYAPSLLLRLPPPASLRQHMLRRFAGAIAATFLSVILTLRLLPIEVNSVALWLNAFGLRSHHWETVASSCLPSPLDFPALLGDFDGGSIGTL